MSKKPMDFLENQFFNQLIKLSFFTSRIGWKKLAFQIKPLFRTVNQAVISLGIGGDAQGLRGKFL